jgi:transposase
MTSVSEVSKRYGISINNICRWKKTCDRKRGAGRKITNIQMEKELIEWVNECINTFGCPPSRKNIQERAK